MGNGGGHFTKLRAGAGARFAVRALSTLALAGKSV